MDSVKMMTMPKDGYHHGDLRAALLAAAVDLIAERGVEGFTLRELSRRAGVSHTAPYHHFRDRAALVRGVVAESYRMLANRLEAAGATAAPAAGAHVPGAASDRLVAIGVAYVAFALDEPARYRLMFRPELSGEGDDDEVASAATSAFSVLTATIDEMAAAGDLAPGVDPGTAVASAWAAVHGVASLILDGGAIGVRREDRDRALRMAEGVARVIVRGLAAQSGSAVAASASIRRATSAIDTSR